MDSEESRMIDRLLDKDAVPSAQKSALKWVAEHLEEGYILNLPPSASVSRALLAFAKRSGVDSLLVKRAKGLVKKYRI